MKIFILDPETREEIELLSLRDFVPAARNDEPPAEPTVPLYEEAAGNQKDSPTKAAVPEQNF